MPSAALQHPQLFLDFLVPTGREKFRLDEVAAMAGVDGDPVSVQSIRNLLDSGKAYGNRFNFRAAAGQEERCKVQWMTRPDVLQLFLATRTAPPDAQLQQLFAIVDSFPPEALALLRQHAERVFVRKTNRL
jgi:hypothetical protein